MEAYREALELNLLSTVALCQGTVPAMQEAGWGRVVASPPSGPTADRHPDGRRPPARITRFLKVLASGSVGVTVNWLASVHATPGSATWTKQPGQRAGRPVDGWATPTASALRSPLQRAGRAITGTGL